MAREYSNRHYSRRGSSAPQQLMMIVVTFLLGYFTATIFDIQTISQWLNSQVTAHQQARQLPTNNTTQNTQIPPKPKFEFYTLLANEKVPGTVQSNPSNNQVKNTVPNTPPKTEQNSINQKSKSSEAKTNIEHAAQNQAIQVVEAKPITSAGANKKSYLLQVAAFKARSDAEHLKGGLILKGYNVAIVPINNARGIWYRVVIGPFTDKTLVQKAQANIAQKEHLKGVITLGSI